MVLDQRRITILSYLNSAKEPVAPIDLASKLGVSKRTLYNDFNEIDHWLLRNQVSPIQRQYRKGIFLEKETKTRLSALISFKKQWEYRFTQVERQYIIVANVLLSQTLVSSRELMELVQVSRGTLFKDLSTVSERLKELQVSLMYSKQAGYKLIGTDYAIWRVIQQLLQSILESEQDEVTLMLLYQFNQKADGVEKNLRGEIEILEEDLSLTFNEQVAMSLTLTTLFLYERPLKELWIEVEEQDVLLQTQAYKAVERLNERLCSKGFRKFSKPECVWLVIRILSSSVTNVSTRFNQDEHTNIAAITEAIIERFENNSGVNFQEKDRLHKNLVAHIKPAYYRLKYNEELNNRYLPLIEQQLKEVYTLTEQALEPLKHYVNRTIPSEEVALIAMHFGGWINRKKEKRRKAYKAVVICENGIAASSMLFSQLEVLLLDVEFLNYIPVRLFKTYEKDIDFAFSTTYINESLIPIIYVPAILGDIEKANVFRDLQSFMDPDRLKRSDFESVIQVIEQNATIHNKEVLIRQIEPYFRPSRLRLEVYKPMLHELVDESMIAVQPKVASWQDAITIAAQPLVENEHIDQSYIDAMIKNVITNGPYIVIAPLIAMPHARPEEGVKKLGISMLKVDEPVHFSNESKHDAQLIIVLAAIDNETHLKALSQLSELLSEKRNIEKILASTTATEIKTILY